MLAHYYDFFFNLDGLLDLASGDLEDAHYDDVLLAALQLYYTSFPTLIDVR